MRAPPTHPTMLEPRGSPHRSSQWGPIPDWTSNFERRVILDACMPRISIDTLEVFEGELPRRALSLVREWASIHHGALMQAWEAARSGEPLRRIPGLE